MVHGGSAAIWQFSQAIQRAFRAGATLAQHVRVNHRRRDVVVAQQFLYGADVRAPLEEGCGKRVTKRVGADVFGNPHPRHCRLDRFADRGFVQVVPARHS